MVSNDRKAVVLMEKTGEGKECCVELFPDVVWLFNMVLFTVFQVLKGN